MSEKFEILETPLAIPDLSAGFDLKQAVDGLYDRCSELEDQVQNEHENARKEMKKFLLGLLDVADALERILEKQSDQTGAKAVRLVKSVESTQRLLSQKLAGMGVQRMILVGKLMDSQLGDSEETEDHPDLEPDTVLTEIVSGYMWNELVLRRAKVIVSA
jgi:molecular chaperone GrpE (heat shock protein)